MGGQARSLGGLMGIPLDPPAPLGWILALPVGLGVLAFLLRWVRTSALLAGIPLGALVLYLGGFGGFLVLVAFFLLGTLLTRLGYSAKEAKGVAEEQGGRRGSSHVAANCTAGLLILLLRSILARDGLDPSSAGILWAAFAGSFAAASSDTASSEIGQLYGRRTVSLRSFRAVPIGTEGAVSIEGLGGGLGAAAVLGLVAWGLGLFGESGFTGFLAVTIGGFLGNFLESLAGTWGRRILPHGWLNFGNTVVGALIAAGLMAIC